MPQGWMATRIPALIFDGIVEIGCLFFLYLNLTRFHGVFAANSRFRSEITPGRRGKPSEPLEKSPAERRRAMNWAQRLKRVFNIDVEVCSHCGGKVKVLACIEDQPVVDQILNHLDRKGTWLTPMSLIPEGTGPPATQLF